MNRRTRHTRSPGIPAAVVFLLSLLAAAPARADEPKTTPAQSEPLWTDPDPIKRSPKDELLKQHGVDPSQDPDQLLEDLEPKKQSDRVKRPEDRFPKLDPPPRDTRNANQITPSGQDGLPKSPLVQVNKSGLKPQVLKKPTGGGSIKGMGLTFQTSLQTGSASLSLPFALPPGRRGLAPSLGLGYSSGGSQGICGMGWSMGVGFIARQTDQGLPRYFDYDRFVYNGGQELVRVDIGSQAVPAEVTADPTAQLYRAKLEGIFWRFFRLQVGAPGEHWMAQDKDGTLYFFGQTPESQLNDDQGGRIFRWNLTRIQDVHGNLVVFEYQSFTTSTNQSYLKAAYYNNHPDDDNKFQHKVELTYEPRQDIIVTYQPGYAVVTDRRMIAVTVWTDYGGGAPEPGIPTQVDQNPQVERALVRSYELLYYGDRYHSMLASVQLIGRDMQTTLPPARFYYAEVDDQDGQTTTVSVPDFGEINTEVRTFTASPDGSVGTGLTEIMDLDADGLVDVLHVDPTQFSNIDHRYILGTGAVGLNGFITPSLDPANLDEMGQPGPQNLESRGDNKRLDNSNVQIMDLDGDGIVEMVHMPRAGIYQIYQIGCDDTRATLPNTTPDTNPKHCGWTKIAEIAGHPAIDLTIDAEEIRLVDVNGDHLTDVVRTAGTRMEHWLNLGRYDDGTGQPATGRFGQVNPDGTLSDAPVTSCLMYKGGYVRFSDPRVKLEDMNGDGLQDIVLVDFGQVAYWPNKGWGQWGLGDHCDETQTGAGRHISMANAPFMAGFDAREVRVRDVNGDGLSDLMRVRSNVVDIWLSAGTSFKPRVMIQQIPFSTGFSNRVRITDVNGSGTRDILWGDAGEYRYIDLTGGVKPFLLVKVENGLGGTTDIEYESHTAHYLRARANNEEWETTCPFPSRVVTRVTTRDNFGAKMPSGWDDGVYVKEYQYRNCVYDGREHEFRGFGETVVTNVGDQNSPTSFQRHYFHQGERFDEALAGKAFRVDTWYHHTGTGKDIYLNTAWSSCAIRSLIDPVASGDAEPGLHADFRRYVRYAYVAQAHTFAFNTEPTTNPGEPPAFGAGDPQSDTISGLLEVRREGPNGAGAQNFDATLPLPGAKSITTHLRTDTAIDDIGQVLRTTRHGRFNQSTGASLEQQGPIVTHASYNQNEQKWIHRPCESWTEQSGAYFNRKLEHYDGNTSSWGGPDCAPSPTAPADCPIGDAGLSTKGEFEECWEGARVIHPGKTVAEPVIQHETDYTPRFGLPRRTQEFRKLENWRYYEQPAGYQALVTREVIRVGTDSATADYQDTPVKSLTVRVDYDVGFGVIKEYRDENDQKTQAKYDALARPIELWGPREPYQACGDGSFATFMQLARIEYHLVPDAAGNAWGAAGYNPANTRPYSYLHTITDEDLCDPNLIDESFVYVDGLGRTRLTIVEGDENAPAPKQPWIANGFVRYDGKGAAREAFEAAYIGWAPGGADPLPVQPNCPAIDDFKISGIDPDGIVCTTATTYDGFGRSVVVALKDGATTRTAYHGPLETWAYDSNDTDQSSPFHDSPVKTRTDGFGRTIETEVVNVPDPTAPATRESYFTTYLYDAVNNLTHLRTCLSGAKWTDEDTDDPWYGGCPAVNSVGQRIEKIQAFDSLSQRRRIVDPDAGTWTFIFDGAGNLVESCDGKCNANQNGGNRISYDYDQANRPIVEKCLKCEHKPDNTVLVRYYYDSAPRMSGGQGLAPTGVADEPMEYLLGRLSYIEDESGQLYFSYDRRGRVRTEIQRIEAPILSLSAAPIGGGAVYISRTEYDDDDRVTRQLYPGPTSAPSLIVERQYNRRGLLQTIKGPDPLSPGGEYIYLTEFQYNAPGQKRSCKHGDASGILQTKWYDRRRRLKRAECVQTIATPDVGTAQDLQKLFYHYDPASNVTGVDDYRDLIHVDLYTGGKNNPYNLRIAYDGLYRVLETHFRKAYDIAGDLVVVNGTGDPTLGDRRREMRYSYNAVGNILSRTTVDAAGLGNPGPEFYEKWLGQMTYGAGAGPHAITGALGADGETTTATYDANGNMTSLEVRNLPAGRQTYFTYTWDHFDRLIQMTRADGPPGSTVVVTGEYSYGFDSNRVTKTKEKGDEQKDVLYVTNELEVRAHNFQRYVFYGSRRIVRLGRKRPLEPSGSQPEVVDSRFLYVGDHLGSSVLLTGDSPNGGEKGCVVSTTSHLPYGGTEAGSAAELCGTGVELAYEFTGKEREIDFGIVYFGARYLNSQLGRWICADPVALFKDSSLPAYAFVRGNPYSYVDPDGRQGLKFDILIMAKADRKAGKLPGHTVRVAARIFLPFYRAAELAAEGRYKEARQAAAEDAALLLIGSAILRVGRAIFKPASKALRPRTGGSPGDPAPKIRTSKPPTPEVRAKQLKPKEPASPKVRTAGTVSKPDHPIWKGGAWRDSAGNYAKSPGWKPGRHKTDAKWSNQMKKRGWTPEEITDAINKGQRFSAPNKVNKGNPATRYVHPTTGKSVIRDDATKELLHVGGPGFKY